jgi:hypothetical protein
MAFIKREENFICENCGAEVKGTGYTNHCPKCLWSKHVDIDPGDRASDCGGMMEPIFVGYEKDAFYIIHECAKCGIKKKNIASPEDNTDVLINKGKY